MSRLAKKPILIPASVTVQMHDDMLTVTGPLGSLSLRQLPGVNVSIAEGAITVSRSQEDLQSRANLGTMCALLSNALRGVQSGFSKSLEIQGIGYKAALEGKTLVLSLGYVNPVRYNAPEDVTVTVEKNIITVKGPHKEHVGEAAANIRAFKKPEPYKGKGIRYQGEVVRMKVGKKAAAGAK